MNHYAMIGATVVMFALAFYTTAFVKEQRKRITRAVLAFFTLGVVCDMSATLFMILGSSHGMLTGHGFIGYSSLLCMLIDAVLFWRFYLKNGTETEVSRGLHLYSRIAYSWWIIAFITGGLLAVMR
jgi:hypothetical protein